MNYLKEFRKQQKLSQDAMARKLNITLSMYEKVEQGRVGASSAFMRRLKQTFPEISIDYIFFSDISNNVAVASDKQKTPRGVLDVERERLAEKRLVKLLKENFTEDELCIGGLGEGEELVTQSEKAAVGNVAHFVERVDNKMNT